MEKENISHEDNHSVSITEAQCKKLSALYPFRDSQKLREILLNAYCYKNISTKDLIVKIVNHGDYERFVDSVILLNKKAFYLLIAFGSEDGYKTESIHKQSILNFIEKGINSRKISEEYKLTVTDRRIDFIHTNSQYNLSFTRRCIDSIYRITKYEYDYMNKISRLVNIINGSESLDKKIIANIEYTEMIKKDILNKIDMDCFIDITSNFYEFYQWSFFFCYVKCLKMTKNILIVCSEINSIVRDINIYEYVKSINNLIDNISCNIKDGIAKETKFDNFSDMTNNLDTLEEKVGTTVIYALFVVSNIKTYEEKQQISIYEIFSRYMQKVILLTGSHVSYGTLEDFEKIKENYLYLDGLGEEFRKIKDLNSFMAIAKTITHESMESYKKFSKQYKRVNNIIQIMEFLVKFDKSDYFKKTLYF